jgi:CRP-like cAMP-binding protein
VGGKKMLDTSCLKRSELFDVLDEPHLNVILSHATLESFPKGRVIFRQGDEATHLYLLMDGAVDLSVRGADQGEFMASQVQKEGTAFGIPSLIEPFRYNVTATCLMPTKVLQIQAEELKRNMEEDPRMGLEIMKKLAFIYFTRLNDLRMGVSKLLKGLALKTP